MTRADYEYYDCIILMEQKNLRQMRAIIPEDTQHKFSLLMDYTDNPHDVADPWYTGNFDETWDDILAGCKGLLKI